MLRLYRLLLHLLPGDFRRDFGDEMERVVGEQWRGTSAGLGVARAARFWSRQVVAVVRAAWNSRHGPLATPPRTRIHGVRQGIRTRSLPASRHRRHNRSTAMDGWLQDLRYSVRSLLKQPAFTLVTVATLALGIGASTSIFSAVYAVLFRGLPYDGADRVVVLFHEDTESGARGDGMSAINARDLLENARHLSTAAVADPYSLDLLVDGRAESLRTWQVSEGFFEALAVEPYLGRTFSADEYQAGGEAVVLLGYRSWRTRFGGDPDIVGQTVTLDEAPVTVIGVLPSEFKFPDEKELWVPRPAQSWDQNARAADYMTGVARLAPGSSLADARAEAAGLAAAIAEAYPRQMGDTSFRLVPLREHLFGNVRTPLLVLLGAVGFVLLIACANVAGLLLARGSERHREFALRSAIGASALRLMRQVTVDAVLLAALGCLLGIAVALGGVEALRGLAPAELPRIEEITIDGNVLLFAVVAAGVSALLAGLAPALRFANPDLRDSLQDGTRGSTAGIGGRSLRRGIVVAEIALAMVLLVGAGLLGRSFAALVDRDLGFDPTGRLALQVFAYAYGGEGNMTRAEFVNQTIDEMEALPGVRRVAITSNLPSANDGALASIDVDLPFTIVDRVLPPEGSEPEAQVTLASDGYFATLGIPVVAGRTFSDADDTEAPPVVVVNETFARRHFPEGDAVGSKIMVALGDGVSRAHEIVGIASDVLPSGYESEPRPEAFFSYRQYGGIGFAGNLTFVLHTEVDAVTLAGPAKEAIWRVNPAQSVWGAISVNDLLGDWIAARRFNLLLLGGFASLSLVLAGIGIYGLISFSVQQRVGEMGIRRALGGGNHSILRLVLGEAVTLAAIGVVIGVVGALALTRFIQGTLYGVGATDPVTFIGLAAAVLAVASLAALMPARRAMRVDPMVALRGD